MAYRRVGLTALIEVAPEEATTRIIEAYRQAQASLRDAAKLLGIHERTLERWVEKLGIGVTLAEIKETAKKEGWHHEENKKGGRPKGRKTTKKRRTAA